MTKNDLEKTRQHFDNTLALFDNCLTGVLNIIYSYDTDNMKLNNIRKVSEKARRQLQRIRQQEGFK